MSIVIDSEMVKEVITEELPQASSAVIDRIVGRLEDSARRYKEVAYQGQIGADLMVNCEDVCIVGEMHAHHRKMKIFVEEDQPA